MHPTEVSNLYRQHHSYLLLSWLLLAVAGCSLIGSVTADRPEHKAGIGIVGLFIGCISYGVRQNAIKFDRQVNDFEGISNDRLQHRWYEEMSNLTQQIIKAKPQNNEPEPMEIIQGQDWMRLHTNAHNMVLGSTGMGKSVLAEYLADIAQSKLLLIHPHKKAGEWPGVYSVGDGRDYQAIAQIMQVLLKEMDDRFKLYAQGQGDFEHVTIIIDELPSIMADDASAEVAVEFLTKFLREARKVQLSLLLLTQAFEVKALGFEGQGSVRDCLNMIRLGSFAVKHAKTLKEPRILEFVKYHDKEHKNKRSKAAACMVDDTPAIVPDLSTHRLQTYNSRPAFLLNYQMGLISGGQQSNNQIVQNNSVGTASQIEQAIIEFSKRKGEVTPSQIKAGIRAARSLSTDEIRDILSQLLSQGIGKGTVNYWQFY